MGDMKGILQSRTVWLSIFAILGMLLKTFGYEFDTASQAQAADILGTVVGIVSSALAIYTRVKATHVIDPTKAVIKQ